MTVFNDIQAALDTKLATITGTPIASLMFHIHRRLGRPTCEQHSYQQTRSRLPWVALARMRPMVFTRSTL